ncbi:hypothetical protein C1646_754770 [Rhizophagus diaphanus]|nr:hypothetical protein C1646_754770 [Rhizophagus diaphanus] [Rhizophagus sp. MUCL 43196]
MIGKIYLDFNNLEDSKNVYVTTYNEVLKELGNPLYFVIPFLSYLPRPEALKKMTKLNNLYDGLAEKKHNLAIFMLAAANALTTILYLIAVHKDEILQVLGDDLMPSVE